MSLGLIAVAIAFTLAAGFLLSNTKASGLYRGSALHPVFLASVFCLVYLFDFTYQAIVGVTALRGITINLSDFQISQVVGVHLWLFVGLMSGAAIAFNTRWTIRRVTLPGNLATASLLSFLMVTFATMAAYVSSHGLSFGLDEIGANKSLNAESNPILASMFWIVVMAAAISITVERVSPARIIFVTVVAGLAVMSSGARSQLVVLLLAVLYAFSLHGLKIGRLLALASLVPFAFAMSILRILSRGGALFYGDIWTYLTVRGGIVSFLFETDEISNAEIFSQFVLNDNLPLDRFPFQGLLGVLFVPLPRAIFPWKPTPLSTDFTIYWSPVIFENSRSELVVGAFSEAVLEFGIVFAPLMLALVGYVTVRLFLRSAQSTTPNALWAFAASVGVLFLIRNEYFIMGIIVWPALIAGLGVVLTSIALKLLKVSGGLARGGAQGS